MRRFSRDLAGLGPTYDAIVIGTGYGGGVAASRLARMGYRVAVLERGREFVAGEFPDSLAEAQHELQVSGADGHVGRRKALYDLHMGRDMHVLVGCGLGGGSLINANVALPPDARIWEDPVWPAEILNDGILEAGFDRAEAMLRPLPFPRERRLAKFDRLEEAAAALGSKATRVPINVVVRSGTNAANVFQPACTACGDCCAGCNVGAKSTVDITYIADAVNHGAEVFTDVRVDALRKEKAGIWRVLFREVDDHPNRDVFRAPERSVTAGIVVLAAGSLGSTEILLRSRDEQGLALSGRLGQSFTGNGDVLAFGYNLDRPVNGVGVGDPPRVDIAPPGPCIVGAIDLRGTSALEDGLIIEEGVIPRGLHSVLPALFSHGAKLFADRAHHDPLQVASNLVRGAESAILGAYHGAIHNTQTFLVMAHDSAGGQMRLTSHGVEVTWPRVAREAIFQRISSVLATAVAGQGGVYVKNPLQTTFLGENLVSVHPLGGAGIGHDRASGVIDHKCRVFDGAGAEPDAVHDGLYVTCGAALPRSVGVNPLLTISALAERTMVHLAQDRGRTLSTAPKTDAKPWSAAPPEGVVRDTVTGVVADIAAAAGRIVGQLDSAPDAAATVPTGVTFTERMAGSIAPVTRSPGPSLDGYRDSRDAGGGSATSLDMIVTIKVSDIDAFVDDPDHTGALVGTITAPALSAEPLDISDGVFNLMRLDPDRVETRRFDYKAVLTSREGRKFRFAGFKVVHDGRREIDLWTDTSTLYVDVVQLTGPPLAAGQGPAYFAGMLTIDPTDFVKQMTTLTGTGGASRLARIAAVGRFGAMFAGALFDVYGNISGVRDTRWDPTIARQKRDLRVPAPDVHYFYTKDDKRLRLLRYPGGARGPVLFTHGLGVSSRIFSIDTIDTNVLEFLVAAGYDCWLLDFRASVDLPYAREPASADVCAEFDYQPAIDLVRSVTQRPTVQVIAHCYGATTFTMALLRGLEGVRSAVISQVSTDVIVPAYPQLLLAHLRTPSLMQALGIDHVDARARQQAGIGERLVDAFIRVAVPFQTAERTSNATSNRITALYGQLYRREQLNDTTFRYGLPEMFGEANIAAFKHLAAISRRKTIVDAEGRDTYLANLHRMAMPICFIHGAENACFHPTGTERTVARLAQRNGRRFYTRHVIPDYGHIDCIFGKRAALDVYPLIQQHLDQTAMG